MTDEKVKIVHDECWSCGREFKVGDAVVEVVMSMVTEDESGVPDHVLMENGLYERHCLRCAYNELAGINVENLDSCFPAWTENASFKDGGRG